MCITDDTGVDSKGTDRRGTPAAKAVLIPDKRDRMIGYLPGRPIWLATFLLVGTNLPFWVWPPPSNARAPRPPSLIIKP